MKDKTKIFSNSNSKEFFVPLNEIKVNVYKVIAKNEKEAIQKVIKNRLQTLKVIELIETSPNCAFLDDNTHEYVNKTISHYEVSTKETKSTSMKLVKKWVLKNIF